MKLLLLLTAAWVSLTLYAMWRDYGADERMVEWCAGWHRYPRYPGGYQMPAWAEARHDTICRVLWLRLYPEMR